jgi:hypothetical protein
VPDIAVATTFIKKLTSVEEAYLRAVEAKRRDARRAWLDIVTREGVSRAAVGQMQGEVQALRREIAALGRDAGRDIRRTVGNYTRKQVDMARRAGLDVAEPVQLEVANTQIQREGEEAFLTSSPVWLDTLESNLEVTAARLRMAGADEATILARLVSEGVGDGRVSLWRSAGNAAQTEETRDVWTYATGLIAAYLATMNQLVTTAEYKKQAVATIDERTTGCCLRVHGQIQPLNKPFKLVGTPRFGDYVPDPPFHWYCRTTEVLYHEKFEEFGISTETMRDAAAAEIDARETTGTREEIYPSHATARRKR